MGERENPEGHPHDCTKACSTNSSQL
jgi:hypothetical protein